MANQHSIFKICVSSWVPREIHARLVKKANERGFRNLTEFIEYIYDAETRNVILTPKDHRKIAADIEAAKARIDRRSGNNN